MMNDVQMQPGQEKGGKSLIDILLKILSGEHSKVSGASGPDSGSNYTEAMTGQRYM